VNSIGYTCKSVHFWACAKDGGHTIRSAIAENGKPHTARKLDRSIAIRFIELELFAISKFYIAGIEIFYTFCSRDLDLDPMTFIYELDPYPVELQHMCENELPTLRLTKVIV